MPIERLVGSAALIDLSKRDEHLASTMSIEDANRRNFTRLIYNGKDILRIFVDKMRRYTQDQIFTVSWTTDASLDEIDVIRDSYKRLKNKFVSPRSPHDSVMRQTYGVDAFLPGDVSFQFKHPEPDFSNPSLINTIKEIMGALPGPPIQMTLEEFMQPTTFNGNR